MPQPTAVRSTVGARKIIVALGGLYVALAVGYSFLPLVGDTPLGIDIVMAILVGGPGVVLLSGGYRLPQSDIRPEVYAVVTKWCAGGIGAMLGLLGLTALAAGLRDPVQNVLILTAIGSVAGFAAGIHDARAKTRELELQETVEQLRTANERLEEFAYAASHDLQEPLRMVSSYLRLLDSRYEDDLDEDAHEFIDFAVGGADRMRAMIESLLEYSRISSGGEPLKPTDTGAVLDGVLDDLQLRIEETNATITVDELPTVRGDADQLAQLFRHLLSNALKYSGEGTPKVHIGVERTDDGCRFSVADEGIGIDPEYQERIFKVFESLHATDESEPDAGGVGLALCERIVERHGGTLWVESTSGEGATFYFTIPTAEQERPEPLVRSS
ncbi:ATP-binding protein [Natronorubrum sp. FCH18a]|uniref:ATP-binding protein n=1 Tax=Natronorubrum sp. FCH18a TaxID=3447018 RepID=UPI003F511359